MAFRTSLGNAFPDFGPPSGDIAIGNAEDVGTAMTVPHSDHTHLFPAPPGGYVHPLATAEADGTSTAPARADHQHAHPASDHKSGGFADLTSWVQAFLADYIQRKGGSTTAAAPFAVYNIEDYGAVAGQDCTAAIAAATSAAEAAPDLLGLVFTPPSSTPWIVSQGANTYCIEQPSNVWYIGAGSLLSVWQNQNQSAANSPDIIMANGASGIGVIGLGLHGTAQPGDLASNPNGNAVYYQGVTDFVLDELDLRYMRQGGFTIGTVGGTNNCEAGEITRIRTVHYRGAIGGVLCGTDINVRGIRGKAAEGFTVENGPCTRIHVSHLLAVHDDTVSPGVAIGYAVQCVANDGNMTAVTFDNIKSIGQWLVGARGYAAAGKTITSMTWSNHDHDGTGVANNYNFNLDCSAGVGAAINDFRSSNLVGRNAGITGAYLASYNGPFSGVTVDAAKTTSIEQVGGTVYYDDCHALNGSQTSAGDAPGIYVHGGGTAWIRGGRSSGANVTYGLQAGADGSVINARDVDLAGNLNGPVYTTSGTVNTRGCNGFNPRGYNVTQPAVPASATALTNTTGCDCTVHVTGGTVSAIAVGGTSTGLTSGSFRVPIGQTITLTYTIAPTWTWFGD